jgi:hypothetical protein
MPLEFKVIFEVNVTVPVQFMISLLKVVLPPIDSFPPLNLTVELVPEVVYMFPLFQLPPRANVF